MIPSEPDDRDVLAGEYVLGLLDAETAQEVEAAMARDPDLARRVLAWEARLLPAASAIEPIEPEPGLWHRIERSLGEVSRATPALAPHDPPRRQTPPGWKAGRLWRSVPLWRGAAGLATAAAILLAAFPIRDRSGPAPITRYFAILQARDGGGADSGPGWIIQIGEDGTVRSIPLGRAEPGEGRALQLWTLWDQARGPVSLGVLPPGGSVQLLADRLPQIGGGQLFEITLEPTTGSPTGRPTGRVLFIGRASQAPPTAL